MDVYNATEELSQAVLSHIVTTRFIYHTSGLTTYALHCRCGGRAANTSILVVAREHD